jgi:uncharacterized damage-inducible protein DinB
MMPGLDEDRAAAQRELDNARQELLTTLNVIAEEDLQRSRRGGWSVGRVVQHIIQSEWHYAHLVRRLRELPPEPLPENTGLPGSSEEAVRELTASRQSLLDALADVDEASFYRLSMVGREEYSVLSVLENVAHHDREHGQQIQSIVASG